MPLAKRRKVGITEAHNVDEEEIFQQVKTPELDAFMLKDMPDSDVFYVPSFIDKETSDKWYESLVELETWYRPTLKVFGREVNQSRKIAAYSTDPKLTLKYSGQTVDMQYQYPPILEEIQKAVEDYLGVKFNHVMLNLYEDGAVYIGNHRDNPENKVIASLSLGAPRTFVMTHDRAKSAPIAERTGGKKRKRGAGEVSADKPGSEVYHKKWVLDPGSLVVMQGDTQQHWKHQIPKEPKVKGGRISLTFRQLVY